MNEKLIIIYNKDHSSRLKWVCGVAEIHKHHIAINTTSNYVITVKNLICPNQCMLFSGAILRRHTILLVAIIMQVSGMDEPKVAQYWELLRLKP